MPPQPLNRIRPNLGFALGIGFLGQRPEAAGLVAQCIAAWTEIELQLGRVMAGLLGIEHAETALAMYLAIENQRIRLGVLRAAAERVLSHRDKKLFDAILGVALASQKDRNMMAHWLWGICDSIPDGAIVMEPEFRLTHMTEIQARMARGERITVDAYSPLRDKIYVWRLKDLNKCLNDMGTVHRLVTRLSGFVSVVPSSRDEIYRQLSREPPIRRILAQATTDDNPQTRQQEPS